jgi:hypothetical protein
VAEADVDVTVHDDGRRMDEEGPWLPAASMSASD